MESLIKKIYNYFEEQIKTEVEIEKEEIKTISEITDKHILEENGYLISNLKIYKVKNIFSNSIKLTLVKKHYEKGKELKSMTIYKSNCKFSNGDNIIIKDTNKDNTLFEGKIYCIREYYIEIIFKYDGKINIDDFKNNNYYILKSNSNGNFELNYRFLDKLKEYINNEKSFDNNYLVQQICEVIANKVLNNSNNITLIKENKIDDNCNNHVSFNNKLLNNSQKKAIINSIFNCKYYHLIHGPPGTGKTETISEIIFQLSKNNKKVLVCGPSNISVDNIILKLIKNNFDTNKIIRIGSPSIISDELRKFSFDYIYYKTLNKDKNMKQIHLEFQKCDKLLKSLSTGKYDKDTKLRKKEAKNKVFGLKKDIKFLEKSIKTEVLNNSNNIYFSTLSYLYSNLFNKNFNKSNNLFDYVIIDEACQASDINILMGILFGIKFILAGDNHQLGCVNKVKSNDEEEESIFSLLKNYSTEDYCYSLLNEQYRMNYYINDISNNYIYNNDIITNVNNYDNKIFVENLEDLLDIFNDEKIYPLLFIDTKSAKIGEDEVNKDNDLFKLSKINKGEANIVIGILDYLKNKLKLKENIGIITPYSLQCEYINSLLNKEETVINGKSNIKCNTVDSFQGQENDIIIISMVRSNPESEIGFLTNYKRNNVAITRAKKLLIVIGNSECIKQDLYINHIISSIKENGVHADIRELEYIFPDISNYYNSGKFLITNNTKNKPEKIKKDISDADNKYLNKKKKKRKK